MELTLADKYYRIIKHICKHSTGDYANVDGLRIDTCLLGNETRLKVYIEVIKQVGEWYDRDREECQGMIDRVHDRIDREMR